MWNADDLHAAAQVLSMKEMASFLPQFMSRLHVDCLIQVRDRYLYKPHRLLLSVYMYVGLLRQLAS